MNIFAALFANLIQRRLLANVLTIALLAIGTLSLWSLPMAEKPAIDAGEVSVSTSYPGASAEEVESNVTSKLEKELLSVSGISKFSSVSESGSSRIAITIDSNITKLEPVYQDIRDAVNRVTDLPPQVIEKPLVRVHKSSNLDFMVVGIGSQLSSKQISYKQLREQAKQLELKLRRISGVGEVNLIDLREREFWIELEPAQLSRYQLNATDIASAIADHNLLATAGNININNEQIELVAESRLDTVAKLEELPLKQQPLIRLKDVATVRYDYERQQSLSVINGERSIGFDLRAAEKADVVSTSQAVRALLTREQQRLGSDYQLAVGFDIAEEIQTRFDIVKINGVTGLILVLLVLALVLHHRIAPWVALSIPFCLLGTIAVLAAIGQILDSYTMAALILIIGIIVDDSVVVSEKISANLSEGMDITQAVIQGVQQVAPAILVSICTTIIAFLPMLWLPGSTGKLLYVLPLTISIALAFSLLDATVVVPSHLRRALNKVDSLPTKAWLTNFGEYLRPLLQFAINHPKSVIGSVLAVSILLVAMLGQRLPLVFFPDDGAYLVAISATMPANLELDQSWQLAQQIDEMLANTEEVSGWYGEVTEASGSWEVSLTPAGLRKLSANDLVQQWQQQGEAYGLDLEFDVDNGGPPGERPIDIRVIGGSDSDRQALAQDILAKLQSINGVVAPRISDAEPVAQLSADIRPDWLVQHGVSLNQVTDLLRIAIEGEHVSRLFLDGEEVRYRLVLDDNDRTPSELAQLTLPNNQGQLVKLGQLIHWKKSERKEVFEHYNGLRTLRVSSHIDANITDPIAVEAELLQAFASHEYSAEIISSSQASETINSLKSLGLALLIAIAAMAMVMMVLFDKVSVALLALLVLPAAAASALLILWLHGKPLSFFACVGIIGMTGVVVNNALVMLYHYRQMQFNANPTQWPELLLEGAISRVRPMLVTSLTTVAGLLPLAYGVGGYDNLMSPIALVIGWGMALSAPVVLMLIPAGYLLLLQRQAHSQPS
ncbi:efflux RND transporter permease subunit [Shewanella maritima]|uniref:Efflux RND transporter permease subunit n=1 Tax=Shewanella maritima TaxID=2520507 RepID=A0A411PI37_9GAMM|nr:efflux RND transporter permease subunit [Shewanella maritima]QBF83020.1 efflux RND transporter permease subunit [Shewanella maritima]